MLAIKLCSDEDLRLVGQYRERWRFRMVDPAELHPDVESIAPLGTSAEFAAAALSRVAAPPRAALPVPRVQVPVACHGIPPLPDRLLEEHT